MITKFLLILASILFLLSVWPNINPVLATCRATESFGDCSCSTAGCDGLQYAAGQDDVTGEPCTLQQSCNTTPSTDSCDCGAPAHNLVSCDAGSQCTGSLGDGCGYCQTPVCNNNGIQDNGETGVDCGGGGCGTCPTPAPPSGCTFSPCGTSGCSSTQRYVSGSCSSYSWFTGNGCYADASCGSSSTPPPGSTPTPAPGIPPTPTISPSPSLSCIYQGYSGSGFTISWGSSTYAVTVVDISTYSDFRRWYSKSVRDTSTTAGGSTTADGFGLTFNPGTVYYVRLWDDHNHSATASFTTPVACVTLSGYVRDSSGNGMANIPLTDYSCQGSGAPLKWSPVTSSSAPNIGYYSISDVPAGAGFCLRVSPTLTTGTASYTLTSGTYEWQVAGQWQPAPAPIPPWSCTTIGSSCSNPTIACASGHDPYDLCADNAYNFTYTPCPAAGTIPVCRTSGGSVPDGACGTTSYAANCTTSCSGSTCIPSYATIWGYVRDSVTGLPVAGAKVQVCGYEPGWLCTSGVNPPLSGQTYTSTLVTDSTGYFHVDNFIHQGDWYYYVGTYGQVPPQYVSGWSDRTTVSVYDACTSSSTGTPTWQPAGGAYLLPSGEYAYGYYCQIQGNNDCAARGGCNLTIDPIPPPPAPTISPIAIPTVAASCGTSYDGSGITISWTDNSVPVTWVDISTDGFAAYYHKSVSGTAGTPTSTDGTGFNGYQGVSGPLTYNPDTNYSVRLYNGTLSSWTTFTFPACVSVTPESAPSIIADSACAPAAGYDGSGITFSWTQPGLSGSSSYAQIQVSKDDPSMSSYHYWDGNVLAGSESISANLALSRQFGSPGFTSYRPSITYYVRFQDRSGNKGPITSFTIPLCPSTAPWIQVTGDVHSNTKINATGGP